jgi:hypothetical protein
LRRPEVLGGFGHVHQFGVDSWLRQVCEPSGNEGEAFQALREMGAKAVPLEIRALTRSDSALERWYRGVHPELPFRKWLAEPCPPGLIRHAVALALPANPHIGEFIPELAAVLNHEDLNVREAARATLKIIDPGAANHAGME